MRVDNATLAKSNWPRSKG